MLYYNHKACGELICIPDLINIKSKTSLRISIINELHNTKMAGHRGIEATIKAVRHRFYWPKISDTVAKMINGCDVCQCSKHNRRKPQGLLQALDIPLTPGSHYSIDFKTDLPKSGTQQFDTLMVVVDKFSKRVKLIPTFSTATAKLTAELFFRDIVSQKGLPVAIISDRDSKFTSNFWRSLWTLTGTELIMSTSRHQNTDGQSENAIRIVEEVLRSRLNYRQDNWASELASLEFALNNTVATPLGMTPFVCETGREPMIPLDLRKGIQLNHVKGHDKKSNAKRFVENIYNNHYTARENLIKAQGNMIRFADNRRRTIENLVVGGECYLRLEGIELAQYSKRPCNKLNPLWYGPLMILEKISPVSFKIQLPARCKIHNVFHVDRLKAAQEPPPGLNKGRTRGLPDIEDGERYEVELILDEKLQYGKAYLLIKWKDFSELYDNSWEPIDEISAGAPRILQKWRKVHPSLT